MRKTIDSYIASFPRGEKEVLEELRKLIHSVSGFEETIAYNMPAFRYHGKIVACFQMYKNHIGFYPYSGSILKGFSSELTKFKTSTGGVQLPKGKGLPKLLIRKIIRARMKEIDSKNKRA
jgi:uncharacterized protein YdhG (YjbR/CyaY superfamily)